jgi:PD-(D/E)XK nuclease family transposase
MKYAFIQLTKFKKKEHELVTPTDKWTYFIKNAKNLKMIPDYVDEEGLLTAYKEADRHNWKKEELIAYDNASMRIQDARGEKELAHEQGMEAGEDKKEREMIINPYKNGRTAEEISNFLQIHLERVYIVIEDYNKSLK